MPNTKTMKSLPARPFYKSPLFLGPLLVILVLAALEFTNTTHILHKQKTSGITVSGNQLTKGEKADTSSANNGSWSDTSGSTPEPGDAKGNSAPGSTLIAPNGTFVSAHKNVPISAALSSVCNTSAGAQCSIHFTSGSTSKVLAAQVTDRGGATYWNSWTPESIGLTAGTWKVTAIATLNGQSKSSDDVLDLVVVE
jgi:hypothetical protein